MNMKERQLAAIEKHELKLLIKQNRRKAAYPKDIPPCYNPIYPNK